MFINRVVEPVLQRYLSAFPAVGITGPRQSGKSTLLRHYLPHYQYVSFDYQQYISEFEADPEAFLRVYNNRVIFDEVQFVPELFNYVKIAIDADRQNYGKFVLTGSNQFAYLQKASESLAGRVGLMSLLPFQYSEMPKALLQESIYRGGYPELVSRDYHESDLWYDSYLDTYLNKDVRAISNIGDMRDFSHFIKLLAANVSQTLDLSNYAKNLGVSVPTIKRWLSILEASYVIFLLPPYFENFGKRLIKSPKLYFYDTGLISYFTGVKTYELYDKGPMAGAIFENYLVSEIKKKQLHTASGGELFYLRTRDGAEIDVILDYKTHRESIEIKKSETFKPKMISTLKQFKAKFKVGYLLYNGMSQPDRETIRILNYAEYLQS